MGVSYRNLQDLLRESDLILQYGTDRVRNPDHLVRLVGATPVGESVRMVIFRDKQQMELAVTFAERDVQLAGHQ